MRSKRNHRGLGRAGYSLLEILIVLTIIGLIATLVGPRLLAQLDRSKVTAARVQVQALMSAVETMYLDIGRYPTATEGLSILSESPQDGSANWVGPYLEGALPRDPWQRDYVYVPPEGPDARPKIMSLGSDGREGGQGNAADIVSGQGR